MASSEQTAWRIYRELSAADRRIVDAWRDLGNDLVTSLLNSRVMTSGHRRRPADDYADWSRRVAGTDEDLVLRRTCEHEAAHAVVARALGVKVGEVVVSADGRSGHTEFEPSSRAANATIAVAGEAWIGHVRALVYPGSLDHEASCTDLRVLLRNTSGDHEVFDARRRAVVILQEYREDVLSLAELLAESRRVVFDGG